MAKYKIKITKQISEKTFLVIETATGEVLNIIILDLYKKYCDNWWDKLKRSIKTKYKNEV